MANMKATLERLLKENMEKDAQINRQNKQNVGLTKKLENNHLNSTKAQAVKIMTKNLITVTTLMTNAKQRRIQP